MQSWMMYQLRFLLAAECCNAFLHFGGLSAQLNLVAIVRNLRITESDNLGLSFLRILSSWLVENARVRVLPPIEFANLLNADQLDAKEQARRDVLLSSSDGSPPPYKQPKGHPLQYSPKSGEGVSVPHG